MNTIRMNQLSWLDYQSRIANDGPPILLPVGALVRLDLIPDDGPADFPPYDMYPVRTDWVPPSGVLSSAKGSSPEKGRLLAQEVAARMAQSIESGFR